MASAGGMQIRSSTKSNPTLARVRNSYFSTHGFLSKRLPENRTKRTAMHAMVGIAGPNEPGLRRCSERPKSQQLHGLRKPLFRAWFLVISSCCRQQIQPSVPLSPSGAWHGRQRGYSVSGQRKLFMKSTFFVTSSKKQQADAYLVSSAPRPPVLWLRPVRHATEPPQQHLHPRPRWPAAAARGSLEPLPVERPCPTKDGAWQRPRLRRLAPPGGGTAKETVAGGKGGEGGVDAKGLEGCGRRWVFTVKTMRYAVRF